MCDPPRQCCGSGLGPKRAGLAGLLKRLTGPVQVAEDTESTVVFLYSKEKQCALTRLFDWSAIWRDVIL